MKVFILLLLVGIASASIHEELDKAVDELLLDFLDDLEQTPLLKHANHIDDETKTELGDKLRNILNKVLEKVKNAVEEGKEVEEKVMNKIRELREQLKALREDIGEKAKDLMEKIKEKSLEHIKNLFDKLNKNRRAVDDKVEKALAELNTRDLLRKLRDHLKKTVDPELLKEKIEKLFGQGSMLLRHFLEMLKEKGRKKMMILIDALLDEDEEEEVERGPRGIKDYWEKVKDYFKDLKIDLQEKYMKFGEWVKNTFDKSWEHSKDKMENIRAIAKEFLKHAKGISKEVANEAGEFFKNYKEELGNVWEEIKERVAEIRNRKD